MPIQLQEENGGKIIVLHLTGKLQKSDYTSFATEFQQLVAQHGRLRVLLDMTGFHGWEPGALWSEVKFDLKHADDLQCLAAVGDKTWEHVLTSVAKPFTKAIIRYFGHADATAARDWLNKQ